MAVKTNYTKNGKEYYRVTATIGKKIDGKPIRKEFYGKSKKEAEQKRDSYLKSIEGLDIDYENATIESMMYMWIWEVIRPSNKISATTFDRYESIYRNYIKNSEIANLKLSEVKSMQIQKYYNQIYEIKKSVSIVRSIHIKLNMFFNYCTNNDLMQKNPVSNKRVVIPGKIEHKSKEVETFSDEEIKRLKENIKGHSLEMIILMALGTGLRRGELLGLYWEDIDFDNCCISVNKTLKDYSEVSKDGSRKYVNKIMPPKTYSSNRIVPIPTSLILTLKQYKLKEKEKFLKNGIKFRENYFIFTDSFCNYYNPSNVYATYSRLLKKLRIPHKKFHALRHTYATQLFKSGVPILTVSKLLGHTNLQTTEIYTHVLSEQKSNAVNCLNKLFI